jgi:MoxR-like ATPase
VLSYDAIADGVPASHAVRRVLQTVPLPQVAPRQRAGGPIEMSPPQGQPGPQGGQYGQPLIYGRSGHDQQQGQHGQQGQTGQQSA